MNWYVCVSFIFECLQLSIMSFLGTNKIPLGISALLFTGWLMVLICLAVSNFSVGFLSDHALSCGEIRNLNDLTESFGNLLGNRIDFNTQEAVNACDISTAWTVFAVLALVFSALLIIGVSSTMFSLPDLVWKYLPLTNTLLSAITAVSALLSFILSISAYAVLPNKDILLDSGYAAIPTFTAIGAALMIAASVVVILMHRRGLLGHGQTEASSCSPQGEKKRHPSVSPPSVARSAEVDVV